MPEYIMGRRKAAMMRIVVRIVTKTVTEAISCPPGCPVISEGKKNNFLDHFKLNIVSLLQYKANIKFEI